MDAMATRKDQTSRRRFLSGASALGAVSLLGVPARGSAEPLCGGRVGKQDGTNRLGDDEERDRVSDKTGCKINVGPA